ASVAEHVRPMLDDPTGTTDDIWRGLANLGTTGLLVPQEHGGAGMTMVEAGIVAEELGAALHPGPWLSCAVAAPRTVHRAGADGEAGDLLSAIAEGATTATVGPLVGPRPEATERGGHTVLRGTIAVPDAAAADVMLVFADESCGTALFAVETAGLQVTPDADVDPARKHFRVSLDGTPGRRLAAAPTHVVAALVDDVIAAYAADALGAAQAVMNQAIEYAKVRRQFGQPIGSFQAVQHLCVDMYETVELARSGVLHALWAADNDPLERHHAAIRAKAFAGRLAAVGDMAIQVFGGVGYTWEHNAHLYLKRLLSWSGFLGAADQYLIEVGSGLARSVGRRAAAMPSPD